MVIPYLACDNHFLKFSTFLRVVVNKHIEVSKHIKVNKHINTHQFRPCLNKTVYTYECKFMCKYIHTRHYTTPCNVYQDMLLAPSSLFSFLVSLKILHHEEVEHVLHKVNHRSTLNSKL